MSDYMVNKDGPRIETARLILRPFRESDASAASGNSLQPAAVRFLSDMVWRTGEEALGFISWFSKEKFNEKTPHVILAVIQKDNMRVIGFVGVGPKEELDNEIELGYLIADGYHNCGYATEAAKAMIWWAFEEAGQDVLSAVADPENMPSRRVLDKIGFIYVNTRVWKDGGVSDYFRLYHTDYLPRPEWDARDLYRPEPMGAFFDVRADGYNEHMTSGSGGDISYQKLGGFFPRTGEPLNILDIGCGTGIELDYIWKRAPNASITCLDLSRGMLDLLLKNHPDRHGSIIIVEASYIDWEYPENTYDIVVSSVTMHHLWPEEKAGVYRKIIKTLKPGGCYIEDDFIVDAAQAEQYRRRYQIITETLPDKASAGEYHIDIPCTLEVQRELLTGAGFDMVEVLDSDIKASGSGAILKATKMTGC